MKPGRGSEPGEASGRMDAGQRKDGRSVLTPPLPAPPRGWAQRSRRWDGAGLGGAAGPRPSPSSPSFGSGCSPNGRFGHSNPSPAPGLAPAARAARSVGPSGCKVRTWLPGGSSRSGEGAAGVGVVSSGPDLASAFLPRVLLLSRASRLDTTPLSAQLGVTEAGGSLLRCLRAWAPHRAGADPEVLLLDVLHALIHTFVPEHLVQRWKEAGSGLS